MIVTSVNPNEYVTLEWKIMQLISMTQHLIYNEIIKSKDLKSINRKWFPAAIENLAQHPLIDQTLNLQNLVIPIEVLHHLQSIDLLLRQKIKI